MDAQIPTIENLRTGRGAKGRVAKAQIIRTATRLFQIHGYEGTTTRDIARLAGVNVGALQYYFGGKAQLFTACAEALADQLESTLNLAGLDEVKASIPGATRNELLQRFRSRLDRSIEHLASQAPDFARWRLVAPGVTGSDLAFDIFYQRIYGRYFEFQTALVAGITGREVTDPATTMLSLDISARIYMIGDEREFYLRSMGWTDVDAGRLALLKDFIWGQILVTLEAATLRAERLGKSKSND